MAHQSASILGGKPSSWYLASHIPTERGMTSHGNYLNKFHECYENLYAKFDGNPRYKNVQVELVGTGFTPRGAQPQLDHTGGVSYYMKGKSKWAKQ